MADVDVETIEAAVTLLLEAIGEDPARPGLAATPRLVAEAWRGYASGLGRDAADDLAETIPAAGGGETVVVRDLSFRSMCEHHLTPFTGTAHVAYRPGERVAGLGRFAAALETVSSRPQVQERLGDELAAAVDAALAPRGVLVVVEASHTCVTTRGARQAASTTVTTAVRGDLADPVLRSEALALIGLRDAPPAARASEAST